MSDHAYARNSMSSSSSTDAFNLMDEKVTLVNEDLEKSASHYDHSHWTLFLKRICIRGLSLFHLRAFLFRIGFALLPSFLQRRLSGEPHKPEKVFPTAYLDGIRGLAALFVFFCHYSYTCYVITHGYGEGQPGENTNILQLPIVRLFYSGPPMVCIFFVISGYTMSLKPLKLMRSHSWGNLLSALTSSVFRRGMRLFIPTTVSTFMVVIMLRLGWYEITREHAGNRALHRNILEHHPVRLDTFSEQLHDWGWKVFDFIHIWSWETFGGSTSYDVHLWTIPVEFRSSMVLFLVFIGLAKVKVWARFMFVFLISWFSIRSDRWEMCLFFWGMFMAELDLIKASRKKPSHQQNGAILSEKTVEPERKKSKIFWGFAAFVALYLMSQPDDGYDRAPGWVYLSSLIPRWFSQKYRFYQCIGAAMFLWAANNAPFIQKRFNHPVIQYFGRHSYAIYLMHGPVLHTIGYVIEAWAWRVTGHDTPEAYNAGFLLGAIFIVPTVIWPADLFHRAVEIPSGRFTKWIEDSCTVSDA